ncbi:tetratricopeptide repeat protein 1 [Falco biarmicus]|uniref:tetratricopeptide repeat protein 1 n=1 Tax=Falco peregrinus TaxID=8954 RepID=UPI000386FB33|nr:tetratricopeptide repeat protein 1 [Falco peregrinus]XP_037253797.1 tetratricopeptide repeat protein 1 [Falco rusticolus]XP_037253798.1 tetratricopeptide repeat protein 1 [Falco rusticolus]XP_040460008.1 tetratricopeptide repeat protein 1 [Falco naumanni]XP_040460009.1 tetratricopeptide repeat protein 1 [Falco naumanni]XP_055574205.1 tetratricopeptide repeat protein 1 [Falco cherrug]XP_056204797.1 tetratricopeptide repeat protein 1 [Falco biarmicus]
MEEFKDESPPEELLDHLKLSDQKSSETGPKGAQNPKNIERECTPCSAKDSTAADECFHDCHDSFEAKEPVLDDEGNLQNDENSARKQTELDEEYLLELEKDMPEEEKQKRRKESTGLKEKGNEQFKKGDYGEAEDSYTKALQICPACFQKDRAILFSNRAAAKMKQVKTEAALSDCSKAVELDPNYIRALLRRAELYEKTEKLDEALEDYKAVLEKDPSVHQAREACMRLPRQIEERNEKLKKEMLGKLKDLGNLVLRPFGLSTENFQIKQDSSTGSYSINFVQNPNNNR